MWYSQDSFGIIPEKNSIFTFTSISSIELEFTRKFNLGTHFILY